MIPLAMGEVISPIMAMKQGFGLPTPPPGSRRADSLQSDALLLGQGGPPRPSQGGAGPMALDVVPSGWDPIQAHLFRRMSGGRFTSCNYTSGKSGELRFASLALAMMADAEKDKDKKDKETKLPEEFLGQAIKEVVMHEVGHSLGLRHNFKASIMLRPDQIQRRRSFRVKGMTGSVMDYNLIQHRPQGSEAG